jgi:hypothetical protein
MPVIAKNEAAGFSLLKPSRTQRVVIHLLFWVAFFGLRSYLTSITFNVYNGFPVWVLVLLNFSSAALIAGCYYFVLFVVWPFILRRKYIASVSVMIGMLVVYTMADAVAERQLLFSCHSCMAELVNRQPAYFELIQSGLINIVLTRFISLGMPAALLLSISIPLCVKLALNAWRAHVQALQLTKDNLELEFNFLKAQINPHFLFNSLNNIYGLILLGNKERSAELVARLSEMLRYIIYDSNHPYMPLDREIGLIQDYVELERVRLNETRIILNCPPDIPGRSIAPLLLMPLVENGFKFCPDMPGAEICIDIRIGEPGVLQFSMTNTVDPQLQADLVGGIGLSNLQKRLQMYYPGKHRYRVSTGQNNYTVILSVELL